jgi:hypothetical protein
MAIHPATAAMGQDSINNYHGLWIFDENTSGFATTNGIKLGTGGARFVNDLNLQDGHTITDTGGVFRFNAPLGNLGAMKFKKVGSTLDADTALTLRDAGGTLVAWFDTSGNSYQMNLQTFRVLGSTTNRYVQGIDGGGTLIVGATANDFGFRILTASRSFHFGDYNGNILFTIASSGACSTKTGGSLKTDTLSAKVLAVGKDTTCEIASFGRTAIADTASNMVGSDSLTCAYIITPFATRAAITIPPSVSGIAATSNLLIIRRPAADTAAYDRYSIVKVRQR